MKVGKSYRETVNSRIRIRVTTIDGNQITGKHETNKIPISAICTKPDLEIHVGQLIEVEYVANQHMNGYVVRSSLMNLVAAQVIYVQHIFSNEMLYISLIVKTKTGAREHALIPSTMRAFTQASLLIPGDNIMIKVNNGDLFEITL